MNEADAEMILWQWLKQCPDVYEVYFNRKNKLNSPTFRVEGESKEIPDFVVSVRLFGREEHLAIEIKNGEEGINIIKSNKILKNYYANYIKDKTSYWIKDRKINIDRFLIATQYSKFGRLFRDSEFIIKNGTGFENSSWINKNVPLLEYSRTKDMGRMLMHDFSDYRKQNSIKQSAGIGWLISDIILNFTEDELKVQEGMVGKPLIQGVFFNDKLKRWSQTLTKF
jgi:hypothetical protein